ncbi:hypothetical protein [Shewanella cutis]|uniref:Lipoprotein n=1 Tax=Shewanella cutis TaxID=2766780 RepID=A0ABS9QQ04_9GAMM|nr:hypothetical protein [Shewanella sp. PS-2]MCG9962424.1 hypothetical protein [Shewanella sp. PS-2]
MYIKYFIIITVSLLMMGCQSTPKGGAIPIKSAKEIKLDVLNIEWSDFSLAPGDRRIKGTGFVVANWSESSNDIGLYFGALGVLASDLLNEKSLEGSLETELKENFDLAKILLDSLNSHPELTSEIKSIHLNANLKNQVITLEPWCIIFSNETGINFVPQLKAILRSESGKAIWEGNYGPISTNKPFALKNSMTSEDISLLKARLNKVYGEITNQLTANIQGQTHYVSEDENKKLTEELMINLDSQLSESLLNKQINKD